VFSHVFVSVTDFERSLRFYRAVLECLGVEMRFCDAERPWAGWHDTHGTRPFFVISKPYDGQPQHPGNGQMIAFAAKSRAVVDAAHRIALENGGTCEGQPGVRPQYHAHYYGAYFRDPDGNKYGVACHCQETAEH
jgi:catechol 2,3-dioxygenase-like lactoylglutathione lyase family enzyme